MIIIDCSLSVKSYLLSSPYNKNNRTLLMLIEKSTRDPGKVSQSSINHTPSEKSENTLVLLIEFFYQRS